jgi:hypothetical protein
LTGLAFQHRISENNGGLTVRGFEPAGPYHDVVEAPSPQDPATIVRLGVRKATFGSYAERSLASAIGQYFGVVQEGMVMARHVFRGLKRPLLLGENMNADENVLVYSWRSEIDAEWAGSRGEGHPELISPPPVGRVFVVLVREEQPNEHGIIGSIERWNWIREDPALPHAPVDWEQRYGQKLWSREIL